MQKIPHRFPLQENVRKPHIHLTDFIQLPPIILSQNQIQTTHIVLKLIQLPRPKIGMTFGRSRVHASATCAEDRPIFFATAETASAIFKFRSLNSTNDALSNRLSSSRFSSDPPEPSAYFPVSTPLASGDHAATVIPNASAIGKRSRSTVRSIKLYSICNPTNGVHPLNSANIFAREIHHAGASDTPTYKTFPARTKSSNPRITSSAGVN